MAGAPISLLPPRPAAGRARDAVQHEPGAIVHVLGRSEDAPRLAPVVWALAATGAFRQLVADLTPAGEALPALSALAVDAPVRRVAAAGESPAGRIAPLLAAAGVLMAESTPTAVVLHGEDDAAAAAGIAAARAGAPLVRIVGERLDGPLAARNAALLERLAELVFVGDAEGRRRAVSAGVDPARVSLAGSPLADAVRRFAPAGAGADGPGVLVALSRADAPLRACTPLAALARVVRLTLALGPAAAAVWEPAGAMDVLLRAGARRAAPAAFAERLARLHAAGAVVTDSPTTMEEAALLGVPCYAVLAPGRTAVAGAVPVTESELRALARIRPGRRAPAPPGAGAGARIADVLTANFARVTAYVADR